MKQSILLCAALLTGCETINGPFAGSLRPLVEVTHVSHALQHVRQTENDWQCVPKCGYNAYSLGIRLRPHLTPGLQIDLLEGYTNDGLHGQREVFTGRFTWEIGARQ